MAWYLSLDDQVVNRHTAWGVEPFTPQRARVDFGEDGCRSHSFLAGRRLRGGSLCGCIDLDGAVRDEVDIEGRANPPVGGV